MNTLKPLGDYLLVTPYRRESTRTGNILLNEKQRDILMGDDHVFWVVAVGSRVQDIKVTDRVWCKFDHDGLQMLDDGTRRGFIRRHEVLAVVTQDEINGSSDTPGKLPVVNPQAPR